MVPNASDERRDGRGIDARVGALEGEGADQVVAGKIAEGLQAYDVYATSRPRASERNYGDRPVLKEPVWRWAVPAYFYVGGAAGAAVVIGEVAELFGGDVGGLVAKARWIGAAGGAIGTGLLIYDLGRPERFLHMLRVFRPTSAMSLGSWTLATAAPVFAASALLPHVGGALGHAGNVMGKAAAGLGLPLAGYTAALLSTTAVPVWREMRHSLPFLFVSSAASSAAALLQMTDLNRDEARIAGRFATIAQLGEVAAIWAAEREAGRIERVGRPLDEGVAGSLWKASKLTTIASLVLGLVPVRSGIKRFARGLFATVGSIALRFAVFHAGKASARDAMATFALERAEKG